MPRPLLIAFCLLTACGAPPPPAISTAALTLTAQFDRLPVGRTQNVLRIHVADESGAPLTGATLHVALTMPAHGHTAPSPAVTELDSGEYEAGPIAFSMSGRWEITTTAVKDSRTGEQQLTATAP
jgi:hypothetical protein